MRLLGLGRKRREHHRRRRHRRESDESQPDPIDADSDAEMSETGQTAVDAAAEVHETSPSTRESSDVSDSDHATTGEHRSRRHRRRRHSRHGRRRRAARKFGQLGMLALAAVGIGAVVAIIIGLRFGHDADPLTVARAAHIRADTTIAVETLKGRLQTAPDDLEARWLLAQVYLESGDGASADKELRIFERRFGSGPVEIREGLGRALLRQGLYDRLLREIRPLLEDSPLERARITLLRLSAQLALGRIEQAGYSADIIERLRGTTWEVQVSRARVALADDKAETALGLLRGLQGDDAVHPEVYFFRGEAERRLGRFERAIEEYSTAITLDGSYAPARVLRAVMHLRAHRPEPALTDLDSALRTDRRDVTALVMQSLALLTLGNIADARKVAEIGLAMQADNEHATVLMALAEFASGLYGRTLSLLDTYRKFHVEEPAVQRLYAIAQLKSGDLDGATKTLQETLALYPDDEQALALLGHAYLNAGRLTETTEALERVVALRPELAESRAALATRLLDDGPVDLIREITDTMLERADLDRYVRARGHADSTRPQRLAGGAGLVADAGSAVPAYAIERTITILRQLNANDDEDIERVLRNEALADPRRLTAMLALVYARKGQYSDARDVAAKLDGDTTTSPATAYLVGVIEARAGDVAAARSAFARTVRANPNFVGAYVALARLATAEGDFDAARQHLERALAVDASDPAAAVALAELESEHGDPRKAIAVLEPAFQADPGNLNVARALVQHRLELGESDPAFAASEATFNQRPREASTLLLRGLAALASGRLNKAVEDLDNATSLAPASAATRVAYATVLSVLGNENAAARELSHAVELEPGFVPARFAELDLALRDERFDDAKLLARRIGRQFNQPIVGAQARAEVALATGDLDAAEQALVDVLAAEPTRMRSVALFRLRRLTGQLGTAYAPLAQWLASHPSDNDLRVMLADAYRDDGHIESASSHYRDVLAQSPDHLGARLGLVDLEIERDPGAALNLARDAYQSHPDRIEAIAAYGRAQYVAGDLQSAQSLLARAVGARPFHAPYRFALARTELALGNRENARLHLRQLLLEQPWFEARDEVEKKLAEAAAE